MLSMNLLEWGTGIFQANVLHWGHLTGTLFGWLRASLLTLFVH